MEGDSCTISGISSHLLLLAVGDAPLNSSDTRTVVSQCSNSLIFGTLKEGGV